MDKKILSTIFILIFINSSQSSGEQEMNSSKNKEKIEFVCKKEPSNSLGKNEEAEAIFKKARSLEKKEGSKDFKTIGSLYRQAVAKNHYKSMRNLQNLLLEGLVPPLPGKTASEEAVEIVERMIKLNIPAGYYAMGYFLENGYGVEEDKNTALSYYKRAADLGNPEGQYAIGRLLLKKHISGGEANPVYNPELGKKFLECASSQGFGEASYWLGLIFKSKGEYSSSINYYQRAVKDGHAIAMTQLRDSFNGPKSDNKIDYLGLNKDSERVRRYGMIISEVDKNPSARFPDIDKIVPLPPAPLPEWDGTFEYKKEQQ